MSSEPPKDYQRYGRQKRAGRGRTLLWLAIIVVLVAAAGLALARGQFSDDSTPVASDTNTLPIQNLLIREGLRREDIAALLDKETGISGAAYLAATAPGPRGRALAKTSKPTSLEGFLFPATYDITSRTTAKDLVDFQIKAYKDNTANIDYSYARSKNLTKFDVLIIASMIEREVALPRERRIVAGVIYNRLKARMRLDIDATTQYAIGEWKPELTAADLATRSPYNTRLYTGLPPGPISNPGIDSIAAAAHPARHRFLYYVARNDGTEGHYFAATPAQFEKDVARSQANAGK